MIEGLGSSRRDGSQRSGAKGAVDDGRDWRVEQDCACLKSVTRAPVLLLKRFPLEVDLTCSPRIPCAAFGAQNGTLGGSVLARRSREAPLTKHHLSGLSPQGRHFNVRPKEKPRNGKVPGAKKHYEYKGGP